MQTSKRGGLSGKARRTRDRNRSTRLHSRQVIEEYLEPGRQGVGEDRYIPIGGRSEFMPAVAHTTIAKEPSDDPQLVLPLTTPGSRDASCRGADIAKAVSKHRSGETADAVIRFPRTASAESGSCLKPPQTFRSAKKLTIRGFLVGCAMGSAAAALLLLVLHTTVG